MAEEPSNPAPLGEITHGPSHFEQFLDKNQMKLILVILAIAVALSAYIVVTELKKDEDHSAGEALSGAYSAEGESYDLAALRDVMESFKNSPSAGSAELLLAQEQWDAQNREESVQTLRDFLANNPEHAARPNALIALANRLLVLEKKDEAIKNFQDVIDHPNGRYLAPFALLTLGD
ncbi:MAG: tetratricopeptide repeat protein, partial [Verrucomicrobia bacterium]|nr:tetratricopeptide repeat protein [Verrucomicrobiota bacterium]